MTFFNISLLLLLFILIILFMYYFKVIEGFCENRNKIHEKIDAIYYINLKKTRRSQGGILRQLFTFG